MAISGQLKILICLLYYAPHRTGYTIHVQHVAEALAARGHEVTVLCARHSRSNLPCEEILNGVKVVRLWAPLQVSRGMIMPNYIFSLYRLMQKCDVVFASTPMLETALVALVARVTGKNIVSTHHGDLHLPTGLMNRMISSIMFQLYKFMAKRAYRLIAYSHDYADNSYYLMPFRNKVSVIYPPIIMPSPHIQNAIALKAKWSPHGAPLIGFSGRFVAEKRPDLLLRALEVINTQYPNARVVFAGQYNISYENTWHTNKELIERYKDQLIFLGLLNDMQSMADFYAALDILVLPSDTECFALVQVEAMLSGTPVIATDISGGRVPVKRTGMGKIVPPGDWQAIGNAVLQILNEPEKYRQPREKIMQIFKFEETIDRYEQQFRNAAEQSRIKSTTVTNADY